MFIKDDIAYVNTKDSEVKIADVKVVNELSLLVTFESGEERIFDMSYLMKPPVYQKLQDYEFFKTVHVENGFERLLHYYILYGHFTRKCL